MSVLDVQFFTLLGICYFQIPVPITITCIYGMVLKKCAIYVGTVQFIVDLARRLSVAFVIVFSLRDFSFLTLEIDWRHYELTQYHLFSFHVKLFTDLSRLKRVKNFSFAIVAVFTFWWYGCFSYPARVASLNPSSFLLFFVLNSALAVIRVFFISGEGNLGGSREYSMQQAMYFSMCCCSS